MVPTELSNCGKKRTSDKFIDNTVGYSVNSYMTILSMDAPNVHCLQQFESSVDALQKSKFESSVLEIQLVAKTKADTRGG